MTSDAPISRAPAVAHSPIGPWANTATVWPISTSARLRRRDAGRGDVGEQNALLVAQVVGDLRQVRLGVGDAEILGLDAVDRVAEPPAADHLPVVLVAGALRLDVGLAVEAGAAGSDRADQHPVADLVAGDRVAELRAMTPTGSWPMMRPGATGYSSRQMWTSVPQIVVSVTLTIASLGPHRGVGFSSKTIRSRPSKTAAFIVSAIAGTSLRA